MGRCQCCASVAVGVANWLTAHYKGKKDLTELAAKIRLEARQVQEHTQKLDEYVSTIAHFKEELDKANKRIKNSRTITTSELSRCSRIMTPILRRYTALDLGFGSQAQVKSSKLH